MSGLEPVIDTYFECDAPTLNEGAVSEIDETIEEKELSNKRAVEPPDVSYIEKTARITLLEQTKLNFLGGDFENNPSSLDEKETVVEKLTSVEKAKIKVETGWSSELIENIRNLSQYGILQKAELLETEINDRKCLVKSNIDLDYEDEDGISNRDRIRLGRAPLDSNTGKPLELHHLGQKVDSPLIELTEEEHRNGEYEVGKKNQSLWHDKNINTEAHGEGNRWNQERKEHWKNRFEQMKELRL